MNVYGIIVAAGKGARMGNSIPKQYLEFGGHPVLAHTLRAFDSSPLIDRIYLVIAESDFAFCRHSILLKSSLRTPVTLVSGGAERQDSVYNGIVAVDTPVDMVVIHDGVRPFIDAAMIAACVLGAEETGACILGVPAADTLKQADASMRITGTLSRKSVWLAQTPQAFTYDLIRQAHENAREAALVETDDAALVERLGHPVRIVPGARTNIKITTPDDLIMAEAIWAARKNLTT